MAALSRFLLLGRSSSSSLFRSSTAVNNLRRCWHLPFSTNVVLDTTASFLKTLEFPNLEKTDRGIFAPKSILNGLPFDSISKSPGVGCLTISRRTKDEIIEIHVEPYNDWDCDGSRYADIYSPTIEHPCGVPPLVIRAEILYGNNFDRCFTAECSAFYEGKDRIDVDEVSFGFEGSDSSLANSTRKHLEFEDFFKKRGIELCNFNFLFDYFHQKRSSTGISTSQICNHGAPPVAYHNIADKIENDIASYSNEIVPLLNDIPFRVRYCFGSEQIIMERRYGEEDIVVRADNHVVGDSEYITLAVEIREGDFEFAGSFIILEKNRLDIHGAFIRTCHENTEEFEEYLKNRGITTKTMGFLWNSLRFKRKYDTPPNVLYVDC